MQPNTVIYWNDGNNLKVYPALTFFLDIKCMYIHTVFRFLAISKENRIVLKNAIRFFP